MRSSTEDSDKNRQLPKTDIAYLFNQYYSRLCFFAFKMVDDPEAAKDIVQDVFLKFWDNRQNFETETATKNFLYLSVRNACLNLIRHEGVEKRYAETLEMEPLADDGKGLDLIIRAEVIGEIQKAIEALPEGCRMVVKLAYMEGLKNEEIAQSMGISINTVKSQKQRALQLLRLKLNFNAFLILLTALHP